jgi:hypothetical protein
MIAMSDVAVIARSSAALGCRPSPLENSGRSLGGLLLSDTTATMSNMASNAPLLPPPGSLLPRKCISRHAAAHATMIAPRPSKPTKRKLRLAAGSAGSAATKRSLSAAPSGAALCARAISSRRVASSTNERREREEKRRLLKCAAKRLPVCRDEVGLVDAGPLAPTLARSLALIPSQATRLALR